VSAVDLRTARAILPGDSLIRSDGLGDVEPALVLLDAIFAGLPTPGMRARWMEDQLPKTAALLGVRGDWERLSREDSP
jgi:hypothetical protein